MKAKDIKEEYDKGVRMNGETYEKVIHDLDYLMEWIDGGEDRTGYEVYELIEEVIDDEL